MILALCVDDKMGLRFNNRRQSRDSAVAADLMARSGTLWIHPHSQKLFEGLDVHADENYLDKAGAGEWCFCEDTGYLNHIERIEGLVLYRWNRVYPRDLTFVFPGMWKLAASEDFPGSSHDTITREEYTL